MNTKLLTLGVSTGFILLSLSGSQATAATCSCQSADGTIVLGTNGGVIVDAVGRTWSINAAGQVAANGTPDTVTHGVVELAYVNGVLWQENSAGGWWGWGGTGWTIGNGTHTSPLAVVTPPTPTPTPTPTPVPTPTPTPSPVACQTQTPAPTAAPAQAVAAGFNTLTLNDEFNGTTVDSTKWSTSLAASGFAFDGGCMTIKTDTSGYSDAMTSKTAFQHGYFEATLKFDPNGHSTGAWPAFWLFAIEGTGTLPVGSHSAELDVVECYKPSGTGACTLITTLHDWTSISGRNTGTQVQNPNNIPPLPAGIDWTQFHKWGVLWSVNKVTWYFDDKPMTSVATGPGTSFPSLELDHMQAILGTGKDWPMGVDSVRIWH